MVNRGFNRVAFWSVLFASLLLGSKPVRAQDADVGCAGDGEPKKAPFAASFLLAAFALPYAGTDLARRAGDAGDVGVRLFPGSARLAVCGRLHLKRGTLVYTLGYEPYAEEEATRSQGQRWGRILSAEMGYSLFDWLTLFGGVRKVAFSYGHDEPEESIALPVRPYLSSSLAPDRRLGITVDDNWGPVRVILGLYESARTFSTLASSDVLATARGVMEPLGPVGRSLSTVADDPYWASRFRVAINVSLLLDWNPRPDAPLGLVFGGDLPMKIGPLGLVVEYLYAKNAPIEGPVSGPPTGRQGAWAQAALMLLRPYLELEGRYEWFDMPSDDRQRFHSLTAGLTGYVQKGTLKLQAAYGHKFHSAGPAVQDDYVLFVMQAAR